ncbi:Vacuolar protein sorting-associated protein 13D [Balamuthia mandrillaris]
MQRIVGHVLNGYMSSFVKDFSSENFSNWELKNLEFKEEVIQRILNVPPNLEVKKVSCSSLSVSIPWSSLRSSPVVFYLGTVDIVLREPERLHCAAPSSQASSNTAEQATSTSSGRGFAAKLLEGVKLQVKELHFTIQTLGPNKSDTGSSNATLPPALRLDVHNIVVQSTNANWEVVDLTETIQINAEKEELILYKELKLGSVSLSLLKGGGTIPIIQDTPITSHVKQKKHAKTGELLYFQVDMNVDQLLLSLDVAEYQMCRAMLEGILSCFSRKPMEQPKPKPSPSRTASTSRSRRGSVRLPNDNDYESDGEETEVNLDIFSDSGSDIDSEKEVLSEYEEEEQPKGESQPAEEAPSMWSRFRNMLYRGYQEETPPVQEDENSEEEDDYSSATDDYEGLGVVETDSVVHLSDANKAQETTTLEEQDVPVSLPEEETSTSHKTEAALTSTLPVEEHDGLLEGDIQDPFDDAELSGFDSNQDINKITYNLLVQDGRIDFKEIILGEPTPFASVQFNNFKASFIPDSVSVTVGERGTKHEIHSTEIQLEVMRFSLFELMASRLKDAAYTTLLSSKIPPSMKVTSPEALQPNSSQLSEEGGEEVPYMKLRYIRHQVPNKIRSSSPYYSTKELHILFNNVRCVYDRDLWKRLFLFFTQTPTSALLDKAVNEGMEAVVESMLYDYLQFKLEALDSCLILPPYAGHPGPAPIASQVLILDATRVLIASCDPSTKRPVIFEQGIFLSTGEASSPSDQADFTSTYSTEDDLIMRSHKFRMVIRQLCCRSLPDPQSPALTLLQPVDTRMVVFFHEFRRYTLLKPQLEFYLKLSDVNLEINKNQYIYFLHVVEHRLAWSTALLGGEDEEQELEKLLENVMQASMAGIAQFKADLSTVASQPPPKQNEAPPILWMAMLQVSKGEFGINVPTGRLAELTFDGMELVYENHAARNVVKAQITHFKVVCPQHAHSPFYVLFSPLDAAKQRPEASSNLLVRWEKKHDEQDLETITRLVGKVLDEERNNDKATMKANKKFWVYLNDMQVSLILSTLTKIQLFFMETVEDQTDKEAQADFSDSVRTFVSDQVKNFRSDWDLRLLNCEALVVEAPDTPECMPMDIQEMNFRARGKSSEQKISVVGNISLHSFMFDHQSSAEAPSQADASQNATDDSERDLVHEVHPSGFAPNSFSREPLCSPFVLKVDYHRVQAGQADAWNDTISVGIERLDVSMIRPQFVMILNLLDNQLADIHTVGTLIKEQKDGTKKLHQELVSNAAAAVADPPVATTYRFSITVGKLNWVLKEVKYDRDSPVEFALIDFSQLRYKYESSGPLSTTSVSVHALRITDLRPSEDAALASASLFRTIIRPHYMDATDKSSSRAQPTGLLWGDDETAVEQEEDAPDMIHFSFDRFNARDGSTEQAAWRVRWLAELQSVLIVYVPELIPSFTEFFTLLEHQKNIRRSYQQMQKQLQDLIQENVSVLDADAGVDDDTNEGSHVDYATSEPKHKRPRSHSAWGRFLEEAQQRTNESSPSTEEKQMEGEEEKKSNMLGVLFKLVFRNSAILLPEMLTESITSLLDIGADTLFMSNDNQSIYHHNFRRTDCAISGCRVFLRTLDTGLCRVVQTVPIMHPVSLQIIIQTKKIEAINRSYTHVKCNVDSIKAFMSISKYRTTWNILYQSLVGLLQSSFSTEKSGEKGAHANENVGGAVESSTDTKATTPAPDMEDMVDSEDEQETIPSGWVSHDENASFSDSLSDDASYTEMLPRDSGAGALAREPVNDHQAAALASTATNNKMGGRVLTLELSLQHLDMAIVSDYVAELELFIVYLKNLEAQLTIAGEVIDFNLNLRFETLVNNLAFRTPEPFIEPTHLSISLTRGLPSIFSDEEEVDGGRNSSFEITALSLDPLRVRITKELVRHIMEIYQLFQESEQENELMMVEKKKRKKTPKKRIKEDDSAKQQEQDTTVVKRSDMHSHFQYIIRNRTETALQYSQVSTSDTKILESGKEASYSFSNPYQPKLLEVMMLDGWTKTPGFTLDVPGTTTYTIYYIPQSLTPLTSHAPAAVPATLHSEPSLLSTTHNHHPHSQPYPSAEQMSSSPGRRRKNLKSSSRTVLVLKSTMDSSLSELPSVIGDDYGRRSTITGTGATPTVGSVVGGMHVESKFKRATPSQRSIGGALLKLGRKFGENLKGFGFGESGKTRLSRTLTVRVRSVGMKRLVDFLPSYFIHNHTDENLQVMLRFITPDNGAKSTKKLRGTVEIGKERKRASRIVTEDELEDEEDAGGPKADEGSLLYQCPPQKRTPICYDKTWNMEILVRPNPSWSWSEPFSLDSKRRSSIQRILIPSTHLFPERYVYMSFEESRTSPASSITFSPPIIIENLSIFPLQYTFPMLGVGGIVTANSSKSFYFNHEDYPAIKFRMLDYDVWSKEISLQKIANKTVQISKDTFVADPLFASGKLNPSLWSQSTEKSFVHLNVFNKPRLANKLARTLYVNTQFLVVNTTSFILFVRQRGRSEMITLGPKDKFPFSWHNTGARQIQVRVANGGWSKGLNIYLPAVTQLTVNMEDIDLKYELLMEVKALDMFSRVITFSTRLHLANQTNYDLVVRAGGVNFLKTVVPKQDKVDYALSANYLFLGHCPKWSSTRKKLSRKNLPSAGSRDPTLQELGRDDGDDTGWSLEPFSISEEQTLTLQIRNLTVGVTHPAARGYRWGDGIDGEDEFDPDLEATGLRKGIDYIAIDVTIKVEDTGTFIYFSENIHPPYILQNLTPYWLKLTQSTAKSTVVESEDKQPLKKKLFPVRRRPSAEQVPKIDQTEEETTIVTTLAPYSSVPYYWHNAIEGLKLLSLRIISERKETAKSHSLDSNQVTTTLPPSATRQTPPTLSSSMPDKTHPISTTKKVAASPLAISNTPSDLPFPGIPLHVLEEGKGAKIIAGDGTRTIRADSNNVPTILSSYFKEKEKGADPFDVLATSRSAAAEGNSFPASPRDRQASTTAGQGHDTPNSPRFSPTMKVRRTGWSKPFSIDQIGEDFEVKFLEEDIDLDNYMLCLDTQVRGRGSTKVVSFLRPLVSRDRSSLLYKGTNLVDMRRQHPKQPTEAATNALKIRLRIPTIDIKIANEAGDEILRTTAKELNADIFKGAWKEYIYIFLKTLQMDNMVPSAEYPVFLAPDTRKLYGYEANILELLIESSILRESASSFSPSASSSDQARKVVLPYTHSYGSMSSGSLRGDKSSSRNLLLQPMTGSEAREPSLSFSSTLEDEKERRRREKGKDKVDDERTGGSQTGLQQLRQQQVSVSSSSFFSSGYQAVDKEKEKEKEKEKKQEEEEEGSLAPFKSIDYIGLRILPLILKADGELLKKAVELYTYFKGDSSSSLQPFASSSATSALGGGSSSGVTGITSMGPVGPAAAAASIFRTKKRHFSRRQTNPFVHTKHKASRAARRMQRRELEKLENSLEMEDMPPSSLLDDSGQLLADDLRDDDSCRNSNDDSDTDSNRASDDDSDSDSDFYDMEDEDDETREMRLRMKAYSSVTSHISMPELNVQKEVLSKWYVERLEIFPLEITFCVGDNELSLPVIQDETPLHLLPLEKHDLYESSEELQAIILKYYLRIGRSEFYKIIGSLDAIGSPLAAFAKVSRGFRDAFVLPWTSLVLDDTPGAFIFGLYSGLSSLFYNVGDASVTTFLRIFNLMSWICLQLTFDSNYKLIKRKVRRNHPSNVWHGFWQGATELGRGLFTGITGVLTETFNGAREGGILGAIKGFGIGFVGIPLKPLGGLFDFFSKTLEGLLHSMGSTSYTIQHRLHEPIPAHKMEELTGLEIAALKQWLDTIGERYGGHCFVKIRTRRGRLRYRLLVLTSVSFHIINVDSLGPATESEPGAPSSSTSLSSAARAKRYLPKSVPLISISEFLVPDFPETNFTVCVSRVVHGRDKFHFVAGDRDAIIERFRRLLLDNLGKSVKVRGTTATAADDDGLDNSQM